MMHGTNRAVPMGSKRLKICQWVLSFRSGDAAPIVAGRRNITIARATAPMGRLTGKG